MRPTRALLSWSSGKDSAWALHVLRQGGGVEVAGLLTTTNDEFQRVAMHGVRRELLRAQAEAAGLPLWEVPLPHPCSNEQYEAAMTVAMRRAVDEGIEAVAFGDLFLEDIRRYREEKLGPTGLRPLFPVWGMPTDELAREMLSAGVVAHVSCVDPRQAPGSLAGRRWDASLLAELPAGADPCGENGEFHTFVSAGPMFRQAIDVRIGEVVERDGFVFADILKADH
jgi:uncharacterized protein (TIGR00290 family)